MICYIIIHSIRLCSHGTGPKWIRPWALSFWTGKPVVLVGQQMEQSFPLEMFRKKRNTFRRSPLFPFLPKWPEYHWTICLITLTDHALWWDTRFTSQNYQWREPFHLIPQRYNWFFHTYCSIWRKILTGFSTQMESAPYLGTDHFCSHQGG